MDSESLEELIENNIKLIQKNKFYRAVDKYEWSLIVYVIL